MQVDRSYSYATHKPLLKMVMEVFAPDAIMEFGIGMHSTPLFTDVNYLGVENDEDWINKVNDQLYPGKDYRKHFIYHKVPSEVKRSTRYVNLKKHEAPLFDFYQSLPQPKGKNKLLFVDCYAGTRRIVLKALKEDFDYIVFHDAQPKSNKFYGYNTVDF